MDAELTVNEILDYFVPDDLYNDFQKIASINVVHGVYDDRSVGLEGEAYTLIVIGYENEQVVLDVEQFRRGYDPDQWRCKGTIVFLDRERGELRRLRRCTLTWLLQTLHLRCGPCAPHYLEAVSVQYMNASRLYEHHHPLVLPAAPELALPIGLPQWIPG